MKIIEMLKIPKYFLLFLIGSFVVPILYYLIFVLGFSLSTITNDPILLISMIIFSLLFGLSIAFQIYVRKRMNHCCKSGVKSSGVGGIGTLGFLLVAECPACTTLGVLFIPVSFLAFLSQYNWLINIISIGLVLFVLNYLGAFKN